MVSAVKLPVNTNATALQMAETMFGKGVTVTSATYSGGAASKGIFSNGLSTSPGVLSANSGVILSTGNASAFTNASGQANQQVGTGTDVQGGVDGNARLNAISNLNTFDGSILETTFVPEGSILTMQIMFSSEEYPEYVNQGFNDAVGIFVNGQRAELSIGSGDISIDNINAVGSRPIDFRPL
ncbi:choice-of-anchor L domain-containing protein, partial [Falsirhodobacter xinxiangensis]|uniref:choice-of-anchor L domain-containing protein n=1 Tax=Falsirhodobacter xinxiangensis TaxID=2530049 RepID=UPI0015F2E318